MSQGDLANVVTKLSPASTLLASASVSDSLLPVAATLSPAPMDNAERAVEFQSYLAQHGIREKIEDALTTIIKMHKLPENPFAILATAFDDASLMRRARLVFDAIDKDGSGTLDRKELFDKLRADNEVEQLMKRSPFGFSTCHCAMDGRCRVIMRTTGALRYVFVLS